MKTFMYLIFSVVGKDLPTLQGWLQHKILEGRMTSVFHFKYTCEKLL